MIGVAKPSPVIFEQDCLRTANTIAPRKAYLPCAAVQIDMDFEVSHRGMTWPVA